MPDRKLTNNEIIKALERLKKTKDYLKEQYQEQVKKCPYPELNPIAKQTYEENKKAFDIAIKAIEEINRLQEKNSNLQEKNSNLTSDLTSLQNDLISAKAENKRLKADIGTLESKMNTLNALIEMKNDTISNQINVIDELECRLKTAKAEAYKECLKKFEKNIKDVQVTLGQTWEIQNALKKTLKELVGDSDA